MIISSENFGFIFHICEKEKEKKKEKKKTTRSINNIYKSTPYYSLSSTGALIVQLNCGSFY